MYAGDILGWPASENTQESFSLPPHEIDDWGETDRPYSLGFTHISTLQTTTRLTSYINVASRGLEHDSALEGSGEFARGDVNLHLPVGPFIENVPSASLRIDCTSSGDDFHYGVDVEWSVEYRR